MPPIRLERVNPLKPGGPRRYLAYLTFTAAASQLFLLPYTAAHPGPRSVWGPVAAAVSGISVESIYLASVWLVASSIAGSLTPRLFLSRAWPAVALLLATPALLAGLEALWGLGFLASLVELAGMLLLIYYLARMLHRSLPLGLLLSLALILTTGAAVKVGEIATGALAAAGVPPYLSALSLLYLEKLRAHGLEPGFSLPEALAVAAAAWLVGALARRRGLGRAGA